VGVYYIGPEDAIARAINQASPYLRRVDRAEMAEVLVINNAPLIQQTLAEYGERIRQEDVGLILFCGEQFPIDTEDLRAIFGIGTFGMARTDRPATLVAGDEADPLHTAVAWRSAPPIYARTVISNPNLMLPVVTTASDQPVLLRMRGRSLTQVFVFGPWLQDRRHRAWENWPYYQYLVYHLVAEAANVPRVLSFSEYPLSPLPHDELRLAIMVSGILLIPSIIIVFLIARRYLFLNPQQGVLRLPRTDSRVASSTSERTAPGLWDTVGFHRPLASFLHLLSIGLVISIPLIYHYLHIHPQDLIPWPQVLNAWAAVAGWLEIAWLLLNLSMNHAAVRYFSALRLRNPREGFRYFQFYFWWQLLGGTLQLGILAWLATVIFPNTSLAHLSYYFIVHAVIQFPGVLRIFDVIFRSFQRFDYARILTWFRMVTPILLEGIFVVLLKRWGAERPSIGQAMGSMFGLGISLYLTKWSAFVVGLILYKRMGLALKPLLLPDFDGRVIIRMLGFGARLTFGGLAIPLGVLLQAFVLTRTMNDYTDVQTAWETLMYFTSAFGVLSVGLFNGLMPALTEAYTQGYQTLTRYYVGQGIRYGMWFGLFIFVALAGVADRFILGFLAENSAGESYALAARMTSWILLWGFLQWPSWLAASVLQAIDKPAIISWLTLGEQISRIGLLVLIVNQWQVLGLLMAYILPLVLKNAFFWILTERAVARSTLARMRLNLWQTLIAPGIAALVIYSLLRRTGDLWWTPTRLMSLRLGLSVIPALLLYGFLTGFLGGWDDGGLVELRQAVTISSFGFILAWLLYQSVRLGTRLSFLHGRFPLALHGIATEEAHALTQRRKLVE
jgi:O-antigen/teichoic acid export membrane protein